MIVARVHDDDGSIKDFAFQQNPNGDDFAIFSPSGTDPDTLDPDLIRLMSAMADARKVITYEDYADFCHKYGIEPKTREEYDCKQ